MNYYLIILSFVASLLVSALMGPRLIEKLRILKFGQEIRDDGPSWHKKKSGTPTMGGIMFIAGTIVASVIAIVFMLIYDSDNAPVIKLAISSCAAIGFGLVGFVDDYIKVVKKRNLGLKALPKFALQFAISIVYVILLWALKLIDTKLVIPFTGICFNMPAWVYVTFALFVITGTVNAVNLTDGIDGLASSIAFIVFAFFGICAYAMGKTELAILVAALDGGLLGFLKFNHYPAKVFMGDTGSLFLGGATAVIAIATEMPLFLIIAGFVYFFETLSVIIQVTSFQTTGKRVFLMTPIHHHFEKLGWSEVKIVGVFSLVTLVLCIIAYIALIPST